jgi:RNA polymerase-binding transcription factor DksA
MNLLPTERPTYLTPEELAYFRQRLLDKREQLLGNQTVLGKAAQSIASAELSHLPTHLADRGSESEGQDVMLGMIEGQGEMIQAIDDALQHIEEGTYGMCEGSGEPICKGRLEAIPWARYTKRYQEQIEANG